MVVSREKQEVERFQARKGKGINQDGNVIRNQTTLYNVDKLARYLKIASSVTFG